jgi:DNA invertase Pin-like site-specific DNA recombinase
MKLRLATGRIDAAALPPRWAKNHAAKRRIETAAVRQNARICLLSQIQNTMSKPKYFLYARKSTEEDDKQIMSIEAQLFELREFARRENLEILEEFQESKSAKTPGRERFNEMIAKIEKLDGVGILSWHPDRLARNSVDGGKIIYLVDQKKIASLRFPTFWFEPTPQGLFMLQVAFGQSKYYSDNLIENITRGIRQKVRRGEWLTRAPFGYVNNPRTRNIEPHPTNARIIVRAFEEYAKGIYTYDSLAHFLAELGIVSRHRTPLGKASIRRMLTNRAYLGLTKHHSEWFEGSFAPILSSELFEAVQKVLKEKERPQGRKRARHDFPFTGLFRCAECGSMFTAQWTTGKCGGKYRYYRCTKKHGRCSQGYVQEAALASQIQTQLQTISLCDQYTDWMLNKVKEWEREETTASQSEIQHLSVQIKASEVRMEKLVSAYLDGDIPKEIYLQQKDAIMRSSLVSKEKLKDIERGRKNWVEPLREWVFDLRQANSLANSSDFSQMKSFVQKIGTNPIIRDKSARFGMPPPFAFAASRRGFLPNAAAEPPRQSGLSPAEVSLCGIF